MPSFNYFYDFLIIEKYKLLHVGVISIVNASNKALLSQHKQCSKHLKKKHPHNNKQNKGPHSSQPIPTPNGDKGVKSKCKNTEKAL